MNKLLFAIFAVISLTIITLTIINPTNEIILYIPKYKTLTFNIIPIVLGVYLTGTLTGIALVNLNKNKKDLNAYKKKYEKISVANEEESAKVKIWKRKLNHLKSHLIKH